MVQKAYQKFSAQIRECRQHGHGLLKALGLADVGGKSDWCSLMGRAMSADRLYLN